MLDQKPPGARLLHTDNEYLPGQRQSAMTEPEKRLRSWRDVNPLLDNVATFHYMQ